MRADIGSTPRDDEVLISGSTKAPERGTVSPRCRKQRLTRETHHKYELERPASCDRRGPEGRPSLGHIDPSRVRARTAGGSRVIKY
jgi:hypothetical protein